VIASFRAEWRKLRRRPAVLVMAGLLLLVVVALGYGLPYLSYTHAGQGFRSDVGLSAAQQLTGLYPSVLIQHGLGGIEGVGLALALIFGALLAGSEYGWGTLKTVFTQRPGRLESLAGRVMAAAAATGIMTAAFWAVAAASSVAVALAQSHAISWPAAQTVAEGLGATWLILFFWSVIGMALGFLLRSAPAAIGVGVAYLLAIEGIVLRGLLPLGGDVLRSVEKFFPGPNVGALIESFGPALPIKAATPLVGAWQAIGVLLLYLAVAAALAAVVVRRRDVAA
jgi:ABC-type transport system involved in multi-copper enzyme maturation permease subunit